MYRLLVISGIIWAIATQFFFLGVLIAITTSVMWVFVPLMKAWKYLKSSPRLREVRSRALAVSGGFIGCLVAVPLFIPMPLNTVTEGVVWIPEEGLVRARVAGWVSEELATSDEGLVKGEPVLRLHDSELMAQIRVATAREEELAAELQSHRSSDVVSMEVVRDQLQSVQEALVKLREDQESLTVRTSQEGTFHYMAGPEFEGRYVRRGEIIGSVLVEGDVQVLAMVSQEEIDLLRERRGRVDVRFADEAEMVYEAVIIRETPMATQELPSTALTTQGGGRVALDPTDPNGQKAFDRWFQIELDVPHRDARASAGGRVYVRFKHGYEPLSSRWGRSLRRLFLSEFAV